MKPAYLITGTDEAKIAAALRRLRERAEREGGPASLESYGSPDAGAAPDLEGLIAAIPAMSLMATRRYLVADGIERAPAAAVKALIEALGALPPELTVVLVERRQPGRDRAAKKPSGLAEAVTAAGGDVLSYDAPTARELPSRLVAEARERGFALEAGAARLLVERMGENTVRLRGELDRLAMWAGPDGEVTSEDLEAMIADTSEEVAWALSDALVAGDEAAALLAAERLSSQGESVTPLVYGAAKRLRDAHQALAMLEAGRSQAEVERALPMHPYAAKMLVRQVRGGSPGDIREAIRAVAELEWWTRGGSEYPGDVALTLTVRRAAGSSPEAG
jgi:DNA polymerase-3 subunit delta